MIPMIKNIGKSHAGIFKYQGVRNIRYLHSVIKDSWRHTSEWYEIKYALYSVFIYPIRGWKYALFTPSNKLKIRNVRRTWCDRDMRMFHACFTLMCDFVEKELARSQGVAKFDEYVRWCEEEWAKPVNEHGFKEFPEHQYRSAIVLKKLYYWYININWDDPVPFPSNGTNQERDEAIKKEDSFWQLCQNNLLELISIRESLWT